MKIFIALAVVALATAGICFPGPNKRSADDDEVEILPFAKRNNNPFGVIDVGVGDSDEDDFPGLGQGWRDGFSSFMRRISDLVKNVRTQVSKDFEDKLKNGNTTSTVEIINGHKVIKNQTVYQDPHTYVKSVIFEVLPNDDDTTNSPANSSPEADTEPAVKNKDREPLEDSVENEVSALNEGENFNIETLEDNNGPHENYAYKVDKGQGDIESFEIIEPESIKYSLTSPGVQNIETLDSNEIPLKESVKYNADSISNDIDWFENFKPIDLSKDTLVNDMLQDQGYPTNPDAEMINLDVPKLVVT